MVEMRMHRAAMAAAEVDGMVEEVAEEVITNMEEEVQVTRLIQ